VGAAKASGAASVHLTAAIQGTIVWVLVAEGDRVAEGDLVVALEAMNMEPIAAHL